MERPLKDLIREIDEKLRRYDEKKPKREELREFLAREVGRMETLSPLTHEKLQGIAAQGGLLVVDGTKNRFGGAWPHYIELYQGMALRGQRESTTVSLAHTPLLDEVEREAELLGDRRLAEVEVRAALQGIEEFNPAILMMDGSLIRFRILAPKLWEELRQVVLERKIPLLGVIEDIKTDRVGRAMEKAGQKNPGFYDREMMWNVLEFREALVLHPTQRGKDELGFRSLFLRSSREPTVVGIDVIEEMEDDMGLLASLVLATTPESGRGIPYPLDLVDEKVRLTDRKLEETLKSALDRGRFETLFHANRKKRSI